MHRRTSIIIDRTIAHQLRISSIRDTIHTRHHAIHNTRRSALAMCDVVSPGRHVLALASGPARTYTFQSAFSLRRTHSYAWVVAERHSADPMSLRPHTPPIYAPCGQIL